MTENPSQSMIHVRLNADTNSMIYIVLNYHAFERSLDIESNGIRATILL